MVKLYDNWCQSQPTVDGKKTLWRLVERERGRDFALRELPSRVLNHYVSDEEIAAIVELLEYPEAARSLCKLLPSKAIGRSGDLGEILAVEFVEERLGHRVPVRRLRGKDHREMAMRGEDVIGVALDRKNRLKLLKGEAKSAKALSKATVEKARMRLDGDHGRPAAHSLLFVARQLVKRNDAGSKALGKQILRAASNRTMPKRRLAHLLFTLSGNPATRIIQDDFDASDGSREQHVANLRVSDHGKFVDSIYEETCQEAGSIGDR